MPFYQNFLVARGTYAAVTPGWVKLVCFLVVLSLSKVSLASQLTWGYMLLSGVLLSLYCCHAGDCLETLSSTVS